MSISLELEKYLKLIMEKNAADAKKMQKCCIDCYKKHNIPVSTTSDIISLRRPIEEFGEYYAFCIIESYEPNSLPKYFNERQIKEFTKMKSEVEKFTLPYIFESFVEISEDSQYIGKITAKELMKLRDYQKINYNENAQRTLKHIVSNNLDYYKIAINKSAIEKIKDVMIREVYIPTTITLNMPENTVYEYDNKNKRLIFKTLDSFDIIDGYHRYLAMSELCNLDDGFDYEMELRIVKFEEPRAQQFIYQEDQKTKMRKLDSESLNTEKISNIITNKINQNSTYFKGCITRNARIFNAADFSVMIDAFYLAEIPKSKHKQEMMNIQKEIMRKMDILYEICPDSASMKWNFDRLVKLFLLFTNNVEPEEWLDKLNIDIDRCYKKPPTAPYIRSVKEKMGLR